MKKNEDLTKAVQEQQANNFVNDGKRLSREDYELTKKRDFLGRIVNIKPQVFYKARFDDAYTKDVRHGPCLFMEMTLTEPKTGTTIKHTPFVGFNPTLNSKYTRLMRALWPNVGEDFKIDRKAFIEHPEFEVMFLVLQNAGRVSNPISKIKLPNGDVAVVQER